MLERLAVRDFRNLERVALELPPEGLAVIGDNGQGKTNLLEAVYYLQLLRSIRGARDPDLVRFDAEAFHISATVITAGRHDISAAFERSRKRKRVTCDGAEPQRLSDALGALPAVIFSPRDVALVAGAPSERRRFLDVVLALTSRRYLTALQAYRAALARRNASLRDVARTARALDRVSVWEPALAENGAMLLTARRDWVSQNSVELTRVCEAIGEHAPVQMRLESALAVEADPASALLQALAARRALDVKRGVTSAGPHRDDLALTLGGHDLRLFGSAGQQRTAAIALRVLEAATLRDRGGHQPMLLLDDPFAELDVRRSGRILRLLRGAGLGQTILAVPRASDIPSELTTLERRHIRAGALAAQPA